MRILFNILLLSVLIFSCQKKKATSIDPTFIGTWKYIEHSDRTQYISIEEDSRGWYRVYNSSGDFVKWSSDMQRKWLIKKDILHFGWDSNKHQRFHIDQYPKKAGQVIIIPYDTIHVDQYYIILDGNYFTFFK